MTKLSLKKPRQKEKDGNQENLAQSRTQTFNNTGSRLLFVLVWCVTWYYSVLYGDEDIKNIIWTIHKASSVQNVHPLCDERSHSTATITLKGTRSESWANSLEALCDITVFFCGKVKQCLKKRLGRLGNETLWNMSTGGEVSTSTSGEWRVKGGPGRPSGLRRQVKFHKVTKKTTVPKTQCDLHMNHEIWWNEMRWNHQWPKKIITNIQSIVNFTYYYES